MILNSLFLYSASIYIIFFSKKIRPKPDTLQNHFSRIDRNSRIFLQNYFQLHKNTKLSGELQLLPNRNSRHTQQKGHSRNNSKNDLPNLSTIH